MIKCIVKGTVAIILPPNYFAKKHLLNIASISWRYLYSIQYLYQKYNFDLLHGVIETGELCGTWFCSVLYSSVSRIPHVPSIDYKATRGHNKNTALTPRWHKKLNSVIYTMELDSEVSMILCSFNFQGHRGVDAIFLNNKNKNLEPLHTIFCSRILGENEFWHKKLLQNGCGTVSLIGEN